VPKFRSVVRNLPICRRDEFNAPHRLDLPGRGPEERELLEDALTATDPRPPSQAEAEEAVEPLLWLPDQLAHGVKLTQTGALPRAVVRAAVERYPDWWDTQAVGPPYHEAELYPLGVLHDLVSELKLAGRRATLQLSPKGRALRADPQRLVGEVAAAMAQDLLVELDLSLARVLVDDRPEIDWSVLGLLTPFNGIAVERRAPIALTSGGRTLAAAILNARAHGPRTNLG
jgi:hypothetical protein